MFTEQMSEKLTFFGTQLDPASTGAGAAAIGPVDMSKCYRALFVIQVGAVGAAGTVDAKLQASATSGGTYADLSPTVAITQVTTANKIVTLEIRSDQVPAGKQFVKCVITVGANAVLLSGLALGSDAPYKPAKAYDVAAVAQRVVA